MWELVKVGVDSGGGDRGGVDKGELVNEGVGECRSG